MSTRPTAAVIVAAIALAGCGAATRPAKLEANGERATDVNVAVAAQKRMAEGKTPTRPGEDGEKRLERAEEEVREGKP